MNIRKRGLSSFVLAMCLLTVAPRVRPQSIHLPPHEKFVLKNGLTVLLLEKHGVPIVNFVGAGQNGRCRRPGR